MFSVSLFTFMSGEPIANNLMSDFILHVSGIVSYYGRVQIFHCAAQIDEKEDKITQHHARSVN